VAEWVPPDNHVNYLLLLLAFGLHTTAMLLRGFRLDRCPVNTSTRPPSSPHGPSWRCIWWSGYGAAALSRRLCLAGSVRHRGLRLDARPRRPSQCPAGAAGRLDELHAALLSLSYGAFGLGAVAALMFLTQERNLKFHKLQAIFSLMPPIQRLEAVVGRLLVVGFVLLTLGWRWAWRTWRTSTMRAPTGGP